jgi:hypothetical protein
MTPRESIGYEQKTVMYNEILNQNWSLTATAAGPSRTFLHGIDAAGLKPHYY